MSGRDTGRRHGAGTDPQRRALRHRLARSAVALALALAGAAAGAAAHDAEASGNAGPDLAAGTPSSVQAAAADARAPRTDNPLSSAVERLRAAQRGIASWYGSRFHGRRTASGERFDMNALTAAHRTLPLDSEVRVRNPANGRTVTVRINDRGPFHPGRLIDLSRAAALALGVLDRPSLVEVSRIAASDAPAAGAPASPAEAEPAQAAQETAQAESATAAEAAEVQDGAPAATAAWQPAAASSAESTD